LPTIVSQHGKYYSVTCLPQTGGECYQRLAKYYNACTLNYYTVIGQVSSNSGGCAAGSIKPETVQTIVGSATGKGGDYKCSSSYKPTGAGNGQTAGKKQNRIVAALLLVVAVTSLTC